MITYFISYFGTASSLFIFLGIGVKLKVEIWNTHLWLAKPRPLAIESGQTVIQHRCDRCGRDFVTDISSNRVLAVFVSVVSFYQLSDEVTTRWLSDACPGRHLSSDENDRPQKNRGTQSGT
jgi:hypothetical protein